MGALTINRKRSDDYFSSFDPHISKKPRLSPPTIYQKPQQYHPKATVTTRISQYPSLVTPFKREIHAPCRQSRTTTTTLCNSNPSKMWTSLSLRLKGAFQSAVTTLRYVNKDKEVRNIDDDDETSSIEVLDTGVAAKRGLSYGPGEMGKESDGVVARTGVYNGLGKIWKESDGVVEILDTYDGEVLETPVVAKTGLSGQTGKKSYAVVAKRDLSKGSGHTVKDSDGVIEILDNYDGEVSETGVVSKKGLSNRLGQKVKEIDEVVEILDNDDCVKDVDKKFQFSSPSVVTMVPNDVNLKVESAEKRLDSLSLSDDSSSLFYVPVYKKLLESADKRNDSLKRLQFQIEYTEKLRETYNLLRPQKKEEPVKEDLIIEPFVPLAEEEEAEVSRALSNSNRRILVTHKNSNIDITGEILQCLRPGAWLNDEVINVYLELLKEREKREPKKYLKCHFFNTFFYKRLINGKGGYNYQSVKRWTSQKKLGYSLFECDKIFVPIHKEIHWCLAVINKKDEKFQYLDSLGGRDSQVLKVLARYFTDELKDKNGKDIDVSSWKQEFVEDLPEQLNGYDCGVFMIKYADFYSRDIGLCFDQEHMQYFRRRTAKEILRLKAE